MPCAPMMTAVLMPMISPADDTSGPPELPGFSAASVCDDVLDHPAGPRLERAAQRRNDAGGDGRVEAERIADRDRDLAALEFRTVAEPRRRQRHVRLDPQQREVGVGIVAENASLKFAAIERYERDDARPLHDMGIGEREPVRGHDDAGTGTCAAASAFDVDPDHARPDAFDDVADDARVVVEKVGVGRGVNARALGGALRVEREGRREWLKGFEHASGYGDAHLPPQASIPARIPGLRFGAT